MEVVRVRVRARIRVRVRVRVRGGVSWPHLGCASDALVVAGVAMVQDLSLIHI